MEISQQQTLHSGTAASTYSQADFPASLLARQANDSERQITATSGRRCCERFAKLPLAGSWAKMFTDLLIGREDWFSKPCVLIWKMQGTRFSRILFRLVPSARRTDATEFGLLPTVMTQGLKVCGKNGTEFMDLKLLPTPTATDQGGGRINKSLSKGAAERPTLALAARMRLLPTPTANDSQNNSLPKSQAIRIGGLEKEVMTILPEIDNTGKNFRLNPQYVAEMMGFPTDWTVLPFLYGAANQSKHSEMP